MKKILILIIPILGGVWPNQIWAQDPITLIIREGVTKAIKAIDLKIQRMQNETIWLQNTQKAIENKMSQLKLEAISGWVEKQKTLYADYFEELWKVKASLTNYYRVKEIIAKQIQIVNEVKNATAVVKSDKHFTPQELHYMHIIYKGILDKSLQNLESIFLVLDAYVTRMTDSERLEIINNVSDRLEQNLIDLRQFNHQNIMLSMHRAKDKQSIDVVRRLYGF